MSQLAVVEAPTIVAAPFDFKNPAYLPVWQRRVRILAKMRDPETGPALVAHLKVYYRTHIADFINDWGVTIDTRLAGVEGRQAVMPFVLMPKQREWVDFLYRKWQQRKPGVTEKSRDCGLSWLAMGASVSLCLFWRDLSIGFGSATELKVDRSGDPDCLFYKGRMFLQYIPREFRGDWDLRKHSAHMRLQFPDMGSSITGEAGDNIGRGGRKGIYFVDEAAHLERPKLVDASLSANTDCRQDISSVNGTANSFSERAHSGKIEVFTFHWRDDPRKDEAWATAKQDEVDPVVWAQEYEINYTASVDGVVIPQAWVQAAIDAHLKLGVAPTGERRAAFDVADLGADKNACAWRHGIVLQGCESWRGKDTGDVYASTERVFMLCDTHSLRGFSFDSDGLGGPVRGDARKINEMRVKDKRKPLAVTAFWGSGEVFNPEAIAPETERKNIDYFENYKAQSYWALRTRFYKTWRAVTQGKPYKPDEIISIDSTIPERSKLCIELSQPVWKPSKNGKVMIVKAPDGTPSPNHADVTMMLYAPRPMPMNINPVLTEAETYQP